MPIDVHLSQRLPRLTLAVCCSLPFLLPRTAHAEDDPLAARRTNVERAELEMSLREREADLAARGEALRDRSTPRPTEGSTSFSRRGRIVLPELMGISSFALVGAPSLVGGIGASGLLSYGLSSTDSPAGRFTTSSLAFHPAADVFVTDHWTVGLTADAVRFTTVAVNIDANRTSFTSETTGYSFSASPRIGRTFDLGPVTLWPKIGVGYGVGRSERPADAYEPASRIVTRTIASRLTLDAVLPVSRYVLFSLGPSVSYVHGDVRNNDRSRLLGDSDQVEFGVQGHLGVTIP